MNHAMYSSNFGCLRNSSRRNFCFVLSRMWLFSRKEQRKRKRTLDFAQFTDWVINHKITNEAEYWVLAGEQKEKKDNPTLWNYGGQVKVDKMIQKAQRGHLAALTTDVFQFASKSTSPFPLSEQPHAGTEPNCAT